MGAQKPSQAINKAYRKVAIEANNFNRFIGALTTYIQNINDGAREETQKKILSDFLTASFYNNYFTAPEVDIDLAIHLSPQPDSPIGVLIEVKSTTNSAEMVTTQNLNKKALQELLYYYLNERVTKNNLDLKHLITTNTREFFIFDAHEFERKFFNNKQLVRDFNDFKQGKKSGNTTDFFYDNIANDYIQKVQDGIEYTYVNLANAQQLLTKYEQNPQQPPRQLVDLYKLFSDTHIFKLSFQTDSNSLNRGFYTELLHIIGIEEKKESGKTIIVRKPQDKRNPASLIEETINQLDAKESLRHILASNYGNNKQEQLFNIALELCVMWVNRVLFLKLLEAQMLNYHNGNSKYRFLTPQLVGSFDQLDMLFFQVLARKPLDRRESIAQTFAHVPYLNSSLFEPSELEKSTRITIGNLSDRTPLEVLNSSVLRHNKQHRCPKELPTPIYLLQFLDAYDFSSETTQEVQDNAKTLINASVLGLIFEKINGHRDGAVFTPGNITMFMCRNAVTQVALQKFNDHYGWQCTCRTDLYNNIRNKQEANKIVNSIRLCDPAVGSGHFLVSALNELILLKYELGILQDANGKLISPLQYNLSIENDELIITDTEDNFFRYNPNNNESQRIQETLFNEKKHIIENCLFGVDINPISVTICRLRLWIELLKNTYYTQESNKTELETLPNIDINIKRGNSLLHRLPLTTNAIATNKAKDIKEYRNAVMQYKNAQSKDEKYNLEERISELKSNMHSVISNADPTIIRLNSLRAELSSLQNQSLLKEFKVRKSYEREKELKQLIQAEEKELDQKQTQPMFKEAFEWAVEFPEVLDNNANFLGFDAVIGNPPYIQLQSMQQQADALKTMGYETYKRTGDIYCLFYELGTKLLANNGYLSFITSNKWMRAGYGDVLRNFLANKTNPKLLVDLSGANVFDNVTVDTNILALKRQHNSGETLACTIKDKSGVKNLSDFVQQHANTCDFRTSEAWVILSPIEQSIKNKIEAVGTPLKDWDIQINYGIKTGYNDAFIITTEKREQILANCKTEEERQRTAELIRPILRGRDIKRYSYDWANLWLICTFPAKHYDIDEYPAVRDYLLSFGMERLEQTGKTHTINGEVVKARKKTTNKWFEVQDSIAYWNDFSKPKIAWPRLMRVNSSNSGDFPRFATITDTIYLVDSLCFFVGKHIDCLCTLLNSKYAVYYFFNSVAVLDNGGFQMRQQYVENIPLPKKLIGEDISDQLIFRAFDFTVEEIDFIEEFIHKRLMGIIKPTC